MIEFTFYLFVGLAIVSFLFGLIYRMITHKELKRVNYRSNTIERLESLEFSYYILSVIFLVVAMIAIGYMLG